MGLMVRTLRHIEFPTWLVAIGVYGGWFALTWWYQDLPTWMVAVFGGWLVAWHGSLQHEIIHGHPTRSRLVNEALAWPPLALWLPFPIYRRTHLVHHRYERLTDPTDDPESYYVLPERWAAMQRPYRLLLEANHTLLGRLVLGPPLVVTRFLVREFAGMFPGRGRIRHRRIWLAHLGAAALLMAWVSGVCGISAGEYLLLFVYPGLSLTLLRSFAEHRAAADPDHRTAIVEGSPLLALLFLNNNLHLLHHTRPSLPWYRLPAVYATQRQTLAKRNAGLVYAGYGEVARRFLVTKVDDPAHPVMAGRR